MVPSAATRSADTHEAAIDVVLMRCIYTNATRLLHLTPNKA